MRQVLLIVTLLPLLGGCVSTAASIVTAPVRVAGWTVDKLTTSQAEADRNRGRRERKAEERERKVAKKEAKRERKLAREQQQGAPDR